MPGFATVLKNNQTIHALIAAVLCILMMSNVFAQSRQIINPGFEDSPTLGDFVIGPDTTHPG